MLIKITIIISCIFFKVSCNFLQRGLSTLHHYIYRGKMSKKYPKVTEIRIFEVLMQAFAAKVCSFSLVLLLNCKYSM